MPEETRVAGEESMSGVDEESGDDALAGGKAHTVTFRRENATLDDDYLR